MAEYWPHSLGGLVSLVLRGESGLKPHDGNSRAYGRGVSLVLRGESGLKLREDRMPTWNELELHRISRPSGRERIETAWRYGRARRYLSFRADWPNHSVLTLPPYLSSFGARAD